MKSTGITRRIDDLGRIVIPKEIRKNLKIKDNEVMEIFIDNDNIILKKFSSFNDMDKLLENFVNVLSDIALANVIITDRDKVVMCEENKKAIYLEKEISSDISIILEEKNSVLSNDLDSIELITNNQIKTNYYIKPILKNGDVLGSIIIFSNKKIEEDACKTVDIISKLITNYIQ